MHKNINFEQNTQEFNVKMQKVDFKLQKLNLKSQTAHHLWSCHYSTVMRAYLKVPAMNSPALLFLSRGKAADCCCFSFFFFSPAEEEQSRGILVGNFQTRPHDGNKVAGRKVMGC